MSKPESDSDAVEKGVGGLLLILSALTKISTPIVAGISALGSVAGYFWGDRRKERKAAKKSEADFIQQIIEGKNNETIE